MADPLLYNALDAYLYSDTQLAAATSQAATHESIRAAGVPAIQCCICCACLCQAVLTACSASDGPGGVQEIIDQYSTCWDCYDCIPNNVGCSGWTTQCFFWPNGQGQCNTSGGQCCQWTVPANVNCVQFDVWGAGAASFGANCCGFSPYGGTGAFVTSTMPTCAGWTYTLCGGCAQCCYLSDYSQIGQYYGMNHGCRSCVCGCNMAMYAKGGNPNQQSRLWSMLSYYGRSTDHCFGHSCAGSGACWCNGGYMCQDNSCATCDRVPASLSLGVGAFICYEKPSVISLAHSPKLAESESVTVPGHWASYCWDTNLYGDSYAPRVPHFHKNNAQNGMTQEDHLCQCFSSGNCCGGNCCSFGQGYMQWPGQGGMWVQTKSGTCRCGDMGRGGAVRVSWKTCS